MRQTTFTISVLLCSMLYAGTLSAQMEKRALQADIGLTYVHFQQQVKSEIGQPRGERLVYDEQVGLFIAGHYFISPNLGIGLFTSIDHGVREQALFDGFDEEGKTQVRNAIGGSYTEFWFGPTVLARYRSGFLRLGYAAIGSRVDHARSDIPSESGDTISAFTTHPTIAWLIGLGASVELHPVVELLVEVQFRPRYYHLRGGDLLVREIEHGTQSIAPLIGLRWIF